MGLSVWISSWDVLITISFEKKKEMHHNCPNTKFHTSCPNSEVNSKLLQQLMAKAFMNLLRTEFATHMMQRSGNKNQLYSIMK